MMIIPGLEAQLGYAQGGCALNDDISQFNAWNISFNPNDLTLAMEYLIILTYQLPIIGP